MKVCIVTVYNSVNSGSFWQAKTLGHLLKKMGMEVYYYKRKNDYNTSSSKIVQIINILKRLIKGGIKSARKQLSIYRKFNEEQKQFKIIEKKDSVYKDIDYFILGSDTIWNLDNKYFKKNYRTYFGGIFKNKKVISYAVSVGNTSKEKLYKLKNIPKMINNLLNISVRDNETLKIISEFTDKNISLVCDPTLLFTREYYKQYITNHPNCDYLFVYLFKDINDKQIKSLLKFVKDNNLKIISGTNNYSWCDDCIINEPINFINYIYNAKFVITDTFHGVVFSINLNKQFVALDRNKNKVNEFLENCKLVDRLISKQNLNEVLKKKINYNLTNSILDKYRRESIIFLQDVLKKD